MEVKQYLTATEKSDSIVISKYSSKWDQTILLSWNYTGSKGSVIPDKIGYKR